MSKSIKITKGFKLEDIKDLSELMEKNAVTIKVEDCLNKVFKNASDRRLEREVKKFLKRVPNDILKHIIYTTSDAMSEYRSPKMPKSEFRGINVGEYLTLSERKDGEIKTSLRLNLENFDIENNLPLDELQLLSFYQVFPIRQIDEVTLEAPHLRTEVSVYKENTKNLLLNVDKFNGEEPIMKKSINLKSREL